MGYGPHSLFCVACSVCETRCSKHGNTRRLCESACFQSIVYLDLAEQVMLLIKVARCHVPCLAHKQQIGCELRPSQRVLPVAKVCVYLCLCK
jgi:hypothetical protein